MISIDIIIILYSTCNRLGGKKETIAVEGVGTRLKKKKTQIKMCDPASIFQNYNDFQTVS